MPRRKDLDHGSRANFYIRKDLPPELLEYINKQYDLTNFILYAIEQLYDKTGMVDLSTVLPRDYIPGEGFDVPEQIESPAEAPKKEFIKPIVPEKKKVIEKPAKKEDPTETKTDQWSNYTSEDPFS